MQHSGGFRSNDGSVPSHKAIRHVVGGKVDLWFFHSPKNNCRFVFCGELVFWLAILLESDKDILSYEPCEPGIDDESAFPESPHIRAQSVHGVSLEYLTRRVRGGYSKSKAANAQIKKDLIVITDDWLDQRRVLLDNWVFLCAAKTRVRKTPWFHEAETLHNVLSQTRGSTLGHLLALPMIDVAQMLGAIADALQRGTAECDTVHHRLTLSSQIRKGGTP